VARQDSAKGAGVVIQALPALLPQYPELRFSIVGEGAGISEFRHSAKELGVARNVVFCGKLAHREVMRVLAESDIFCFPTGASDGFPKAVLEGLASGLPLVATDVSVLPQLLQHGCGALMKERSPEAFVAAVRQVLSTPDNYETMSRQAIQTAKAYSLEAWRDTIREHLESAWGPLRREKGRSRETGVRKDGDTTRLLTES
jgi:glycosyltransferase involved in cell wall biosynthesis